MGFRDFFRKADREQPVSVTGGTPTEVVEGKVVDVSLAAPALSSLVADSRNVQGDGEDAAASSRVRELLLKGCPQTTWSLDAAAMLFSRDGSLYTPGREEFRTLRARLDLVKKRMGLRTFLVTSPLPRDGKTFIAAGLAQVILWQQGHHVLLIDGDLRGPRLHVALGAPSVPGLSDYLRDNADEFAIIKRGPLKNLFFIPGGKPSGDASELIANGRLKLLLDRLAPAFDWIIIDSPPVIPISDARLMGELCDGVLVVVLAGVTPYEMAQRTFAEFEDVRFRAVVLNRVDRGSTYGYYHSYYSQKYRTP